MPFGNTLRGMLEGYSFGTSEYACVDCGEPVNVADDRCPDCAGDLTALEADPERGWDPLR